MKAARVAKILGVDQKTITNWTDHLLLRRFFTVDAISEDKRRNREYSESDVLTLNTIRVERARNTPWEEIATILNNGYLDRNLPASSLLVDSAVPAVQYERFLALSVERDTALKEVERLKQENESKNAIIDALQQEIRMLNREIGKLEGKIEMLEEDDE